MPPSNPSWKLHEVRDHVYLVQDHVTQFLALGLAHAVNVLHELTSWHSFLIYLVLLIRSLNRIDRKKDIEPLGNRGTG